MRDERGDGVGGRQWGETTVSASEKASVICCRRRSSSQAAFTASALECGPPAAEPTVAECYRAASTDFRRLTLKAASLSSAAL